MINRQRVLETFLRYVKIDSESHFEKEMAEQLVHELTQLGLQVTTDQAGLLPDVDSNGSNVYGYLPGDSRYEPILFSSHMDTVCPGKGINPVVQDGYVFSDGITVLGADDKSGIAAIVEALHTVIEHNLEHRPVEVVFTIREEGGLCGSRHLDYGRLRARYGVVLDASNGVGKIVSRAPGQTRLYADIYGVSSHAGSDPEKGVSAIMAGARAVSNMKLLRIDRETTANIGTLSAVGGTNVVNDHMRFEAEARSASRHKLENQIAHMESCLREACEYYGARLELTRTESYAAYQIPDDHPHLKRVMEVCRAMGIEPWTTYTGGGTDGNNFNAHGIETIVLACGMEQEHSCRERLEIAALEGVSELVCRLMCL